MRLQRYTMKKALIALFLLLIPVGLFAADIPNVVVVSIDALHPSALAKDVSPNLWQIMQEGQYTLDGKSVTPPQTLINHSAMLTGVPPEKGGRADNNWRPGQPQVAVTTLFDDMKRRGYANAFFYSKPKLGYLAGRSLKIDTKNITAPTIMRITGCPSSFYPTSRISRIYRAAHTA